MAIECRLEQLLSDMRSGRRLAFDGAFKRAIRKDKVQHSGACPWPWEESHGRSDIAALAMLAGPCCSQRRQRKQV